MNDTETRPNPLGFTCPRCHAQPGERCAASLTNRNATHAQRRDRAKHETEGPQLDEVVYYGAGEKFRVNGFERSKVLLRKSMGGGARKTEKIVDRADLSYDVLAGMWRPRS